jgi:hypothetical protein
VQNNLSWLQMVIGVAEAEAAAPSLKRIADVDLLLTDAGRDMGVPPRYIVPTDRRENIDKQTAQQIAAGQLAIMAKNAAGGAA